MFFFFIHKITSCIFKYDFNILEIIIQDYGIGIKDLNEALNPSFSSDKENEHAGMGFTIMQTLSDNFEVKSYPGLGTKLIIIKELTPLSEEVY